MTRTQLIQDALNLKPDDIWGPKTDAAVAAEKAASLARHSALPKVADDHSVIASVFADPADIAAFKRCKAQGKSDEECFKVGDNAIGVWGDGTGPGTGPSCALPPEDMEEAWGSVGAARGKRVIVTYKTNSSTLVLKDRMPHRANIKNGAGIDLNEDARQLLGIPKGAMVRVLWRWA